MLLTLLERKKYEEAMSDEHSTHIRIAVFNFRDSFKLAQRAFRGERVTFVKINLVHN